MKPGDLVEVTALWSTFRGQRGRVTKIHATLHFVHLRDERLPLAFGLREIAPVEEREHIALGE